ncbi:MULTISPECIES: hypothetical protein [Exiguobacterium]|uniref:GntR family transcriptional regulator n=1 Tax=Exiguobacterium alkaliphilum TaxID=1428684 RepID=A0ABT2KZT8_9BACL|nr:MULTISPECIES: hypothetical protein [Exiguobacterium]MCT4795075.1 hypothetical protein [Exiguobacterium alkaliphilum]QUE85145.1 hypothetical protein KB235_07995 [Exiguobacterium alkaliphilum]
MKTVDHSDTVYQVIRERATLLNRKHQQEEGTSIRIHDIALELHCTDELILESLEFAA